MEAVRREWLHAAAQALTWFGILLDAARPRNRIGLPDEARESRADLATRTRRQRPRPVHQR